MIGDKKLIGTSVLTALAASICCITPVLAVIAGTSGIASTFSWVEPFRPYLIGLTVLVLVFAWYQKLQPKTEAEIDCECEDEKTIFYEIQEVFVFDNDICRSHVGISVLLTYFLFQPDQVRKLSMWSNRMLKKYGIIEGMTCEGCEAHVESEVNKLDGIL